MRRRTQPGATGFPAFALLAVAALLLCSCDAQNPSTGEAVSSAETMELGRGYLEHANWPSAIEAFESVLASSPSDEDAAAACLSLGHCWQYRSSGADFGRAAAHYQRVVDDYPTDPARPWAMLALARMADVPESPTTFDGNRADLRERCRPRYRAIIESYPGHMAAHEAALRLAMLDMEQVDDADARQRGARCLEDYLARWPENYLAATMHTMLGYEYLAREDYAAAVKSLTMAADLGLPTSNDRAKEYYRIARLAEEKLGDYALAIEWYQRLVDETPLDNRYSPSRQGVLRCRHKLAEAKRRQEGAS